MTQSKMTIPELAQARLHQMVETALVQPQLAPLPSQARAGINGVSAWLDRQLGAWLMPTKALAVVTAMVLVVLLSVQFDLPTGTRADTHDAFTDISDYMALDLLDHLS